MASSPHATSRHPDATLVTPRNGDGGSARVFHGALARARQKYGVTQHGSEIEGSNAPGAMRSVAPPRMGVSAVMSAAWLCS